MDNIEISAFFIGAVVVRIIGKWLKRVIKQQRPIPSNSYGMPSGRGIIMGYTMMYFLLLFPNMNIYTKMVVLITTILACYMKYYLREHTIEQLIVGLVIGLILGYITYIIMRYYQK